jgi:two-component system, chemotaxis family, sensor kinase Cph1
MINDLLSFSRVGSSIQPFTTFDASIPLQNALHNLSESIRETNAKITYTPMPIIFGDESQMVQLFQNLLSNAMKFRGENSPDIHITAETQADQWLFSVKDNGIGIDPKFSDKIFNLFQRLHTRKEYPGTGIDLAIVKKTVERHNGRVWIESRVGQGSTFFFTLARQDHAGHPA